MFGLRKTQPASLSRLRLFHTTAITPSIKKRFFVYAPDYPDHVAQRYSVREEHLRGVKIPVETGKIRVGGMLVNPDEPTVIIGNETRNNATGSVLIMEGDTIEEVRELIERDIYWKKGVWDKEKLVIQSFHTSIPFP